MGYLSLIMVVLLAFQIVYNYERFFDFTKHGKAVGTVIRSLREDSATKCIYQCLLDNQCESVNFNGETKECELLQENWDASNILFTNDDGWAYYGSRKENQNALRETSYAIYPRDGANLFCDQWKGCMQVTSCQKIKDVCENCQAGFYWLLLAGNYVKSYCDMKTESGTSCKKLKEICKDCQSGFYGLRLGDDYVKTFCDMETSSGGWMMVGNVSVINEDDRFNKHLAKVESSEINSLSNVSTGGYVLSVSALQSLKAFTGFTEIRIKCYKPWHNRTFHATMKSSRIISTFLTETGFSIQYTSCKVDNEIEYLSDDTSLIGKKECAFIGHEPNDVLYNHAIIVLDEYHVHIYSQNRLDCDDYPGRKKGDQRFTGWWQYFVR